MHSNYENFHIPSSCCGLRGPDLLKYLIQINKRRIAVFKAADEVPGENESADPRPSRDGIASHITCHNEVIVAGLFPYRRVPAALETSLTGPFYSFGAPRVRTVNGVLQEYVPQSTTLLELQTAQIVDFAQMSRIRTKTVHEMAIIDLFTDQTDRHPGNILYSKTDRKLHFIDHALIAPSRYLEQGVFQWLLWPQAHTPFSEKELNTIKGRSFNETSAAILAAYPDYPPENLEILRINDYLVKTAATKGLSPFQIGWLFSSGSMRRLYYLAKDKSGNAPKKTFANMTQLIDQTIKNFQRLSPDIYRKIDPALRPCERSLEIAKVFDRNKFDLIPLTIR